MDPNATLIAALTALENGDGLSASDYLSNLSRWIREGGFLPTVERAGTQTFRIDQPAR